MKPYSIILVLLVIISSYSYSYSLSELDSLFTLYARETEEGRKAQLSYNIGQISYNNDPNFCKKIIYQTIRDSSKIKDKIILGKNMIVLGLLYRYQNNMDSSYYYFRYALKIGNKYKNQNLTNQSAYNIAINYGKEERYLESISALITILKRYEETKTKDGSIGVLYYIGNNFLLMKNNKMSLIYQKKALDGIDSLPHLTKKQLSLKANILNSIGLIYVNMMNRDSAMYYFNESLKIKEKNKNLYAWCNTKLNLCSLIPSKSDEYIKCNKDLLNVLTKLNDQTGIIKAKINLIISYSSRGELHKAIKEGRTLIDKYKEFMENEDLAQLYKTIGSSYFLLKKYQLAYEYRVYYDRFQDSIRQEIYENEILSVTEKYQSEKKNKEISQQKLQLLNADLKISNREKGIFGISFISLSIILFILVIMQIKKRKIHAEKKRLIIEERERGLNAVFIAQEEERKRIAKDLHDGIGQQISVVKFKFQYIAEKVSLIDTKLDFELDRLNHIITETANDIRTISHQMMPRALVENGLLEAVEELLEYTFRKNEIQYSYEYFGFSERLASKIEIALYRIIQELLQNIMKHSQAKIVDIQLSKINKYAILMLRDDGIGIKNQNCSGMGLMNINNRLSTIDGSMDISAEKCGGTTVSIRILL